MVATSSSAVVPGAVVPGPADSPAAIRLQLRGRSWSLDEMERCFDEKWNFGEKARVVVARPGGLSAGEHEIGLAERLNFVTTYLADLKHQYGDAPGLAMVSDVLVELTQRRAPPARPGSARDPDPDY